jgi:antitoxin ParD1/3/4
MDIRLAPKLEEYVRSKVASGHYGNASEVVSDALRLLLAQDELNRNKLEALRSAIRSGLASGVAEDFSFEALNAELDEEAAQGSGGA